MDSDLKIFFEDVQGSVPVKIFHLRGWLDAQSEGQLLEDARNVSDAGTQYVVIDMKDLDTLTSAGMRALQKVYQVFTPKEDQYKVSHLKLCNAPAHIYNVLGVTGFLQHIPMYESLGDAIESFGKD
jgi:anti-anti-sigma factor